ncbi:DNA helicase [Gordonia phage Suzy]|uniref:DNA helicase n=1 Tax=Gordonia phage Suzy TaxID=2201430 RepID=A0A2Z4Q842_9CAUD|nr:DNA helicase [Gordonia phage Suzy]AWY06154.1 DNA helicase [Gordonia phage Suzy]
MGTIWLDKVGNKLILKSDWHDTIAARCKEVGGGRWDPKRKAWVYDLHWHVCLRIRKLVATPLGWPIRLSTDMKEWAEAEKLRQDSIPDPTEQKLIQLALSGSSPRIWDAVSTRKFQTVGIDFGNRVRRFVLADDPGLGKTLQTIGMVEEAQLHGPILVVANKSAQQITWPNEIRKWTDDKVVVFDTTIPKAQRGKLITDLFDEWEQNPEMRTWVIMNPYWVRMKAEVDDYGKFLRTEKGLKIVRAEVPELFMEYWAGVFADESHETLATSTGNAKKWSQQRQGMGALNVMDNGFKVSISGTPMRGKPTNMFGQLNWLYPEQYTGFWPWAKRHFAVTDEGYGGALEVGELLNPKDFYKEIAPIMIRRTKAMVASDLPPKQYGGTEHPAGDVVGVWLPLLPAQQKAYDQFVKSGTYTDENDVSLEAIGGLAQFTRMKQLATSLGHVEKRLVPIPKIYEDHVYDPDSDQILHFKGEKIKLPNGRIDYMVDEVTGEKLTMTKDVFVPELPSNKWEWLKEWLMERDLLGKEAKGTGKVLIASQFRQVLNLFRDELKELGTESFAITGETSAKNRVKIQDQFQNNPDSPKICFLQTVAAGTSLTLDAADDVIILDEMWDPDKQTQLEDRAHRLSRVDHTVTIWYVRSLGTIEEDIGVTVSERFDICHAVLNGTKEESRAARRRLLPKAA